MKLYTKQGDEGFTYSPVIGRVSKDSTAVEALGNIDELNAAISTTYQYFLPESNIRNSYLPMIQDNLFSLGAQLSTDTKYMSSEMVSNLETLIDQSELMTKPLTNFILPQSQAANLHMARAICRRAERSVVKLKNENFPTNFDHVIPYLNRLSDLLFIWSRRCSADKIWLPPEIQK